MKLLFGILMPLAVLAFTLGDEITTTTDAGSVVPPANAAPPVDAGNGVDAGSVVEPPKESEALKYLKEICTNDKVDGTKFDKKLCDQLTGNRKLRCYQCTDCKSYPFDKLKPCYVSDAAYYTGKGVHVVCQKKITPKEDGGGFIIDRTCEEKPEKNQLFDSTGKPISIDRCQLINSTKLPENVTKIAEVCHCHTDGCNGQPLLTPMTISLLITLLFVKFIL